MCWRGKKNSTVVKALFFRSRLDLNAGFADRPAEVSILPSVGVMEADIFDHKKKEDTEDFESFQGM